MKSYHFYELGPISQGFYIENLDSNSLVPQVIFYLWPGKAGLLLYDALIQDLGAFSAPRVTMTPQ